MGKCIVKVLHGVFRHAVIFKGVYFSVIAAKKCMKSAKRPELCLIIKGENRKASKDTHSVSSELKYVYINVNIYMNCFDLIFKSVRLCFRTIMS